jgi:hypothetical protein
VTESSQWNQQLANARHRIQRTTTASPASDAIAGSSQPTLSPYPPREGRAVDGTVEGPRGSEPPIRTPASH